ncbi:hypothetical protein J1605_009585 [Eschrichtius robustus]|uniref:Uncharacterized protein n=1 Tax=Eschrichtius robustus TaxID=9764 RepID=A0AB34GVJ2_ESCRO|nr:hypothetical protein J1605_009585 [Eschrichtius robustus]
MVKGRNSMLLHVALHLPKPLVMCFPLDTHIFSFSSSRWLGYLYFAHHLSCSMPHHALLCVTTARPPVLSRIPLASDHPDFLRRGDLTPLHSAQKTRVEMSRRHMSEHTLVWLAKMMYPWMEGQMEEQMPQQGQLYVPPPISGQGRCSSLLFSLYVLRFCRYEPDWEVGRISTMGCNCYCHSCRGTTPLTDPLEMETWARRHLPSEDNTELTASSAGRRSARCGAVKTWKVK